MAVHQNKYDTSRHNEMAGKLEVLETLLATVITNDLFSNSPTMESKNLAKVSDGGDLDFEKLIAENGERGIFGFNGMEKENTVTPSTEAFSIINSGLESTLGQNHGFGLNGQGDLMYNKPSGTNYNSTQQKIIDRMTTVIDSKVRTNVSVIEGHDPIATSDGNSFTLDQINCAAVTLTQIDQSNNQVEDGTDINVYIDRNPISKDGTTTPSYFMGVFTLHEFGHVYLRLTDAANNSKDAAAKKNHNTKVENFDTELRQIYKTDNIPHDKASAKRYNKAIIYPENRIRKLNKLPLIIPVEEGDDKTLRGSEGPKH